MITILLASYSGVCYIGEQINSLLNQTIPFDTLYIQDDRSIDGTWELLEEYKKQYPDRIMISRNEKNSGNPKYNFYSMMSKVRDDYIMLCDQDDVWFPNKIEISLVKIQEMERKFGKSMPLLVHTDSRVVDEDLNLVHPSLKDMIRTADIRNLDQILLQNHVTGGTAMYNNALAQLLIGRQPEYMVMHDWWLAITGICFGELGYLPEATVNYRQHGKNSVGARDVRGMSHKWYKITHMGEICFLMQSSYRQAQSFLATYSDLLTPEQKRLLQVFDLMMKSNKWKRLSLLRENHLFRKGFFRKISQIVFG